MAIPSDDAAYLPSGTERQVDIRTLEVRVHLHFCFLARVLRHHDLPPNFMLGVPIISDDSFGEPQQRTRAPTDHRRRSTARLRQCQHLPVCRAAISNGSQLLEINIPHSVALRGAYRSATDYASSMIVIGADTKS